MKKYLFITNSEIPSDKEWFSKEPIKLKNDSLPCIEAALSMGYEVFMGLNRQNADEVKCMNYDVKFYKSGIYRNIYDFKSNSLAFKNLINIIRNEKISVIHCNSPIGGLLGRLCGHKKNVNKIIYTVHGFHFYKDAPLINNTIFKWVEMLLAHYTDAIITINREDYEAAKKLKLRKGGKIYYISGVGVDTSNINNATSKKNEIIKCIKANKESIILISVGDLNSNKNNEVIIKALGMLKNPKIHYILCGIGNEKDYLISLSRKYGIEDNIHFFGYRSDIPQLLKSSDIYVMPSYREGLSRSLMEAMSAGLPCIVSSIRGNVDLIKQNEGGYLCNPDDVGGFGEAINILAKDSNMRSIMGINNKIIIEKYDVKNIKEEMKKIYSELLGDV